MDISIKHFVKVIGSVSALVLSTHAFASNAATALAIQNYTGSPMQITDVSLDKNCISWYPALSVAQGVWFMTQMPGCHHKTLTVTLDISNNCSVTFNAEEMGPRTGIVLSSFIVSGQCKVEHHNRDVSVEYTPNKPK